MKMIDLHDSQNEKNQGYSDMQYLHKIYLLDRVTYQYAYLGNQYHENFDTQIVDIQDLAQNDCSHDKILDIELQNTYNAIQLLEYILDLCTQVMNVQKENEKLDDINVIKVNQDILVSVNHQQTSHVQKNQLDQENTAYVVLDVDINTRRLITDI